MTGFRCCLSSVMDPCAAWDGVPRGPRLGPPCSDYEADWDAAGSLFTKGEYESRALHIDAVPRLGRPKVTHDGAAGGGSPRLEVRALSIDSTVRRRAHSEPPADLQPRATRAELKLSMQAFGIIPDIDAAVSHRRRSAPDLTFTTTHGQAGKMAASFGDIEGLLKRRHFHGSPPPGNLISPRLAARAMEMVDIDTHARRPLVMNRAVSASVIPVGSPCYDLASCSSPKFPGSPRGRTSTEFFKKTLEAKQYAKLLGRAGVSSGCKSLAQFSADDLERELRNLQKQDGSRDKKLEDKSSGQRELEKVILALESPAESYRSHRSFSKESISTTTSTEAAAAMQTLKISEAAKSAFDLQLGKFSIYMSAHAEEEEEKESSKGREPESEPGPKVSAKLRRVLAAMDTDGSNIPEAIGNMKSLIPIFQKDKLPKSMESDLQGKLKPPANQNAYYGRSQRFSLRSSRQVKLQTEEVLH
mmetsp:Transcript_140819/g.262778  ORF Transcript_140819/g.262778 Transcript_140819/m.262778 type:complete len:472 (-) Transcript_140819:148-1563(-)